MSKRTLKVEKERDIFLEWMERLGYAKDTLIGYRNSMNNLIYWCAKNGKRSLESLKKRDLVSFKRYLEEEKQKPNGEKISGGYVECNFNMLKLYSSYLQNYGKAPLLLNDIKPTPFLESHRLPLTQEEIASLYRETDNSLLGYRDRAILALYYGCGLRRTEGLEVLVSDLDVKNDWLLVRKGKNGSQRKVPLSVKTKEHLAEYLIYSRPYLAPEIPNLLVTYRGKKLNGGNLDLRIKKLGKLARIEKPVMLHVLRHSIATHLLSSGMPLEYISKFIGHSSLESTQVYTHLTQ